MGKQQSFTDIEYANRKRRTKRDEFLEMMDELIPWEEWVNVIVPYYFTGKRGRPPRGIEIMLRMYLLANWFNLADEAVEDAIYDSYAFRKFMGLDWNDEEQVPDATTLCKFRKILNDSGVAKLLFDTIKNFMEKHGKLMHGGSIVDATIIDAPSSTRACSHYPKYSDFERILCQASKIFEGIISLFQENFPKHGAKFAKRWILSGNVNRL